MCISQHFVWLLHFILPFVWFFHFSYRPPGATNVSIPSRATIFGGFHLCRAARNKSKPAAVIWTRTRAEPTLPMGFSKGIPCRGIKNRSGNKLGSHRALNSQVFPALPWGHSEHPWDMNSTCRFGIGLIPLGCLSYQGLLCSSPHQWGAGGTQGCGGDTAGIW